MKKYMVMLLCSWMTVTAEACFPFIPLDEVQKGYDQADRLLKDKDAQGLIKLLKNSNYIVEQRAALYLAKLGAKESLPILKEKDLAYPRGTSISLGAFYAAIIVLENNSVESRRQILLTAARTGFKDIDDVEKHHKLRIWMLKKNKSITSEDRQIGIDFAEKKAKKAKECILKGLIFGSADDARRNAAAEYLLEYANKSVIAQLEPVRAYGAQYTVLAYRCQQLNKPDAIELCIEVLGKHETPQKAESAQRLLESFGQAALAKVQCLMKEHEKQIDAPPPPFSIHHTIVSRCSRIIKAIEEDQPEGEISPTTEDLNNILESLTQEQKIEYEKIPDSEKESVLRRMFYNAQQEKSENLNRVRLASEAKERMKARKVAREKARIEAEKKKALETREFLDN